MQKAYVLYGPPGTGKSTTLMARATECSKTIRPNRIGFVSFTKSAAQELADRLGVKPGGNISTVHSMAFRLARISRDQVINYAKLKEFQKTSGIEMTGGNPEESENVTEGDNFLALHNLGKARLQTSYEEIFLNSGVDGTLHGFIYFCEYYEKFKKAHGYIDFADMLDMALNFDGPKVDVLFVDEAQDLSPQQWRLVEHWAQNINTVHIAGDDDQCQPPGTMVATASINTTKLSGGVPIETLKKGDTVRAYSQQYSYFSSRKVLETASRQYSGDLIEVVTHHKSSRYTPNHTCMVKFRKGLGDMRVLYLMKKGKRYRIGQTKLSKERGTFYPTVLDRQERADCFWILDVFNDKESSFVAVQVNATKYGIPQSVFACKHLKLENKSNGKAWEGIEVADIDLEKRAFSLLKAFGKIWEFPYITWGTSFYKCHAINLDSRIHLLAEDKGDKLEWVNFEMSKAHYEGKVYSLKVEKTGTYIADGIFTHNSIYKWGGADPQGMVNFQNKHKAEKQILTQSYRIPATVHGIAQNLIERVSERVEKSYAPRDVKGSVQYFSDPSNLRFEHGEDCMVLYRNHYIRNDIEEVLIARVIPFTVVGGKPGPLEMPTAVCAKMWVKMQEEYKKAGDKFPKGQCYLTRPQLRKIAKFAVPKYKGLIEKGQLHDLVGEHWSRVIGFYWDSEIYLKAIEKEYGLDVKPTIRLSTIHGSKGREAHRVILINGMSDKTLAGFEADPDSEIRTFYVGVTRARHVLHIVDAQNPLQILRKSHGTS